MVFSIPGQFFSYLFHFQDGNATLVQAASVSIHGAHGQYIENVHLKPYESERHFWDILYPQHYSKIISKAEEFIKQTDGTSENTLVFIRLALSFKPSPLF